MEASEYKNKGEYDSERNYGFWPKLLSMLEQVVQVSSTGEHLYLWGSVPHSNRKHEGKGSKASSGLLAQHTRAVLLRYNRVALN